MRERLARAAETAYCRTQAGDLPQTRIFENVADAVLAEIAAAGMVLVPKEPTEAMLEAVTPFPGERHSTRAVYRAMLSAAPSGGE
jgi:hypothetical protein